MFRFVCCGMGASGSTWLFVETSNISAGERRCRRNHDRVVDEGNEDGRWEPDGTDAVGSLTLHRTRVLKTKSRFFMRSETGQGGVKPDMNNRSKPSNGYHLEKTQERGREDKRTRRQEDRKTERQKDKKTKRQKDKKTKRQKDKKTRRQLMQGLASWHFPVSNFL